MLYSEITNTDLKAGKLILGTDRFGTAISEEESFAMLDRFAEKGGNLIDTASFYADWLGMGKSISEKTIGKWIASRNIRDNIIISTKGGHFDMETGEPRLTLECVREDFENSLINLKTDYIDIYWLHKDDVSKSPEELIDMLNRATEVGSARYLGVSNWSYDRIKRANDYAAANGLRPIIASQIQYSIAKVNKVTDDIFVMTDDEYKKYCGDNLNVFGFSSQAKGFFAIMDAGGEEALSESVKNEFYNEYNVELFKRVKKLASEKNTTVPAIVIAALVSDKRVNTFAQAGPQNVEQLNASFEAFEIAVSEDERKYLFDI